DVWSDIACPWCYIGHSTLHEAIEQYDGEVTVRYHSYELAPDTPTDFEGSEVDFLVDHKGMSSDQVQQMLQQVTATGQSVGVTFDFDRVRHTNTLRAHEALHYAAEHGKQEELLQRLFLAYFTEGRHVGQDSVLAELAVEVGLDGDALLADLNAERYAGDVHRDIKHAQQMGVRGVPFFVFAGQYGVSGAQSAQTFTEVLDQVASEVGSDAGARVSGPRPRSPAPLSLKPTEPQARWAAWARCARCSRSRNARSCPASTGGRWSPNFSKYSSMLSASPSHACGSISKISSRVSGLRFNRSRRISPAAGTTPSGLGRPEISPARRRSSQSSTRALSANPGHRIDPSSSLRNQFTAAMRGTREPSWAPTSSQCCQ